MKFGIKLEIDTDIHIDLVLAELENNLADMKYNQKDDLTQLNLINEFKINGCKEYIKD